MKTVQRNTVPAKTTVLAEAFRRGVLDAVPAVFKERTKLELEKGVKAAHDLIEQDQKRLDKALAISKAIAAGRSSLGPKKTSRSKSSSKRSGRH
jgi:hypothetical protein